LPLPELTHAELVERAASWLRNRMNCRVVLTEQATGCGEIPDAIGWKYGSHSYLVECKVSRADFFSDRMKPFRADPVRGIGLYRYYMAPAGVLSAEDVDALGQGWGLLLVRGRSVVVARKPTVQARRAEQNEIAQLVQALAMVQSRIPEPLHKWTCAPGSPYGQMRARRREIAAQEREEFKTRTCSHFTVADDSANPRERFVGCKNLVAWGHTRCSEHGGKSRRIKLQA
jgi:hypothetical protein